jgi:DNA uptake protein ComE-like DNA-binding protein
MNDFKKDLADLNTDEIQAFQQQIDSLKLIELENRKPKIFPFNPNYINDFKGSQLGMSVDEIDRLLEFRKGGRFVNSASDFQKITEVSDSLLDEISIYFKFPDWVTNPQKNENSNFKKYPTKPKVEISTTDINLATAQDFTSISGIGEKLSERIINYRKRLQGFIFESQLYEVWNIDKEVIDRLLEVFSVQSKPTIKKININTATFKEILKNPYIDYELCKAIFNYKDQIAEYQSLTELKEIPNFPADKYDRIVLYLLAE